MESNEKNRYPSLLTRVQSNFIDGILILIVATVLASTISSNSDASVWVKLSVFFLVAFLYEPICMAKATTLGNFLMKVRVRSFEDTTQRISLISAFKRVIVKYLIGAYSFIAIHFNKERRAVHDIVSGSVMIDIGEDKATAKPKSFLREWGDAALFAIVAATIIRWIFMEAFTIPTPSMENSLLMGDYLFVSKFHYGARTPKTPLQVPLTHQYIWGTKIPSYSEAIQLPQFRLPGFSKVKNNDVVVFNWPADEGFPTDLKMNYIKRCMGIAGDTLQVKSGQVYINGKVAPNAPEMQFNYKVFTQEPYPRRIFRKYNIPNYSSVNGDFTKPYDYFDSTKRGYVFDLSKSKLQKMLNDKIADSIQLIDYTRAGISMSLFPFTKNSFEWSIDNYGPLWIPKKGATIKLDSISAATYEATIRNYEGWESVERKGDKLIVDGKVLSEYTFKQNYYFMMGDNRHNSSDSRFWGFVPEDHIVGKAYMIWLSMDAEGSLFSDKIRWKRMFSIID